MLLPAMLALSGVGCGGGASVTPASAASASTAAAFPLEMLLPADTAGVLDLDVRAVRATDWHARLDAAVEPVVNEQITELRAVANRVDRLVVGYGADGSEERTTPMLILARGSFTQADVDALGSEHASTPYRDYAMREGRGTTMALVGEHTIVFGDSQLVRAALDRADGLAPMTGPTTPEYLAAAAGAEFGQHMLSAAVGVTEAMHASFDGDNPVSASVQSAAAWLDLGAELLFHARLEFSSETYAAATAIAIQGEIDEVASNPMVGAMGLADALRRVHVQTQGTAVVVDGEVDNATLEALVARLLSNLEALATEIEEEAPVAADSVSEPMR